MSKIDLRVLYKEETGLNFDGGSYSDYNANKYHTEDYIIWLEERLVNLIKETHKNIKNLK